MLSQFNFRKINSLPRAFLSFASPPSLSHWVMAHFPLSTTTSADCSICITYSSNPPSVRRISLYLSLLHLLFWYCPLSRCWTSAACDTSSDLIASVCSFCSSVQTLQSGLLHHSPHGKLACHLLSFPDLHRSTYGTCTLWNAQLHELYSPFKAHTKDKTH
jgi:hypothetical protein